MAVMNALDLIGPAWELVPLRIPGGWAVRHNGLDARRLADGRLEANDSEDLLWLVKLPPPDGSAYRPGADSGWREIHLDTPVRCLRFYFKRRRRNPS